MSNTAATVGASLERKNLIRQIAERNESHDRTARSFNPEAWNRVGTTNEYFFSSEYDSAIKQEHGKLVGPVTSVTIPHDPDADISDDRF